MNRMMTALALSGLFIAAPAFAKTATKPVVAGASDKAVAGSDAKPDAAPADAAAKPAKKTKKSKKATTETKTETPAPSDAPAK